MSQRDLARKKVIVALVLLASVARAQAADFLGSSQEFWLYVGYAQDGELFQCGGHKPRRTKIV